MTSASRKAAIFYTKRAIFERKDCESLSKELASNLNSSAMHASAYWTYAKCLWRAEILKRLAARAREAAKEDKT